MTPSLILEQICRKIVKAEESLVWGVREGTVEISPNFTKAHWADLVFRALKRREG